MYHKYSTKEAEEKTMFDINSIPVVGIGYFDNIIHEDVVCKDGTEFFIQQGTGWDCGKDSYQVGLEYDFADNRDRELLEQTCLYQAYDYCYVPQIAVDMLIARHGGIA